MDGRWLTLRILKTESDEPAVRIGISKRVAKLAVRRNRMKRLIREGLRHKIQLEPGHIYWIRALQCPPDADAARVEKELIELFR